MSDSYGQEPLLDIYIFETTQLIEQLEQVIICNEEGGRFTQNVINEVFRIMHTIKGSSAMMMFDNIATVSHSIEDLFYFLREKSSENIDYSKLSDLVLCGVDFIKGEVDKVITKEKLDGDSSKIISDIKAFLSYLKEQNQVFDSTASNAEFNKKSSEQDKNIDSNMLDASKVNSFKAVAYFEDGCEMEDIRAFSIVQNLSELTEEINHIPEMLCEGENSAETIKKDGFKIFFKTYKDYEEIHKMFMETPLLRDLELVQLENGKVLKEDNKKHNNTKAESSAPILETGNKNMLESKNTAQSATHNQNIISVNVSKLDKLMDMVGELVISQSMVIQNPDLEGLELDNFQKAARQLQKITSELQDTVMSIRMVPLAATFNKMNRIVRDMSKKLSKEVKLKIIGEDTEVDKNIIEHISDPLMHLIRNSIDHGLEAPEERKANGKSETGTVTLEAKSEGGDVVIIVKDDGKGLNRKKILDRCKENGLINKPEEEITDKEMFSYIFLPGFSTNDNVTEFSGRGVGMDVVTKNISEVGGNISIDSTPNEGTIITLKIPLTLAIMDGMTIRVGKSTYTIPITNIKESFRAKDKDIFTDTDSNEMIMIRGECYPVLRLHELYKVKTKIKNISEGIIVMVNNGNKSVCIFADGLIGEQQVVVKALPDYIKSFNKINGLSGCTLLGDGSISLILDVAGLINY